MRSTHPGQYLRMIFIYTILLAIYPVIGFAARYQLQSRSAVPPYTSNVPTHGQQKRVDRQCTGFIGDQDTYGLGIRIGLYFQWITSSIAYTFVPSEAITMRGINNCFQGAMFAGLLFVTITKGSHGELHAVEAYLMLIFCMGGVCSGSLTDGVDEDRLKGEEIGEARGIGDEMGIRSESAIRGGRECNATVRACMKTGYAYLETSTLGGYVRLLLACGFIAYGLWFVFTGMDGMLNAFPGDCRYAFFLSRVDLSGRFREFLKALFILTAIPALVSFKRGTVTLFSAARGFFFRQGWQGRSKPQPEVYTGPPAPEFSEIPSSAVPENLQSAAPQLRSLPEPRDEPQTHPPSIEMNASSGLEHGTGDPGLQHVKIKFLDAVLSSTLLVFIIAVELTIRWNKIEGVQDIGSTGQLLPLIIGVGGVGRVLMHLISDALEKVAWHRQKKHVGIDTSSGSGNNGMANDGSLGENKQTPPSIQLNTLFNNLNLGPELRVTRETLISYRETPHQGQP